MIAVSKELPKNIKIKLADELEVVINDPEFKQSMKSFGLTVKYLGHEECKKKWITDHTRLSNLVKQLGIADLVASPKN